MKENNLDTHQRAKQKIRRKEKISELEHNRWKNGLEHRAWGKTQNARAASGPWTTARGCAARRELARGRRANRGGRRVEDRLNVFRN